MKKRHARICDASLMDGVALVTGAAAQAPDYRLLELPPELEDAFTSGAAPITLNGRMVDEAGPEAALPRKKRPVGEEWYEMHPPAAARVAAHARGPRETELRFAV